MSGREMVATLRDCSARCPRSLVCAYLYGSAARGGRRARVEFETRKRAEYFDVLPYLPIPVRRCDRSCVTDVELLEKKLAFIEACVQGLRTRGRPEPITNDVREERRAVYTLQVVKLAALDVASRIVSDDRLGEAETNRQSFDVVAPPDRVPAMLTDSLRKMAGLRNVVVHGDQALDEAALIEAIRPRLGDLLDFAATSRPGLLSRRWDRGRHAAR